MSYHVLEVRKVDEKGEILSQEFFVVDGVGNQVAGPLDSLQNAILWIEQELKNEQDRKSKSKSNFDR